MQQVYVEVLSGRARFDERSSLKTFLFGIANNLARSRLRRLKTRLRLLEVWSSSPGTAAAADQSADSAPERVWIAVKALPPRQRDVVELVFCRDMTIEEASSVMGVSVGTARTHYERAKKALASELHTLREYIAGGGSP
jgi:RNA polymerase sigma-70 factor (ECF subfamily)